MIASLLGLKGLALAAVLVAVASGWGGWSLSSKLCKADELRAANQALTRQLISIKNALDQDTTQHGRDAMSLEELDAKISELTTNPPVGDCLSPAESDRLRDNLWK